MHIFRQGLRALSVSTMAEAAVELELPPDEGITVVESEDDIVIELSDDSDSDEGSIDNMGDEVL